MPAHLYQAPADCPVCGDDLIITRKGCLKCGTELAGEFSGCGYCALDTADLELLRVFLGSRGNLREVEKHLAVSYPTARARLDAVVAKLGFGSAQPANADQGEGADPRLADMTAAADKATPQPTAQEAEAAPQAEALASPQEQILARVANGELSSEVAAQLIAQL